MSRYMGVSDLMTADTRHKSLYLQMKGRGARLPLDAGGHLRVDADGVPLKDRFWMEDFVGVRGLGSGKSSLMKMTEAELKKSGSAATLVDDARSGTYTPGLIG